MSSSAFTFVVAAALIDQSGRILLAQRPEHKSMGGLWEFPGGKVDDGETPDQALARELKEELNIDVAVSDLEPLTFVSHGYNDFNLFMPLYICRHWCGEVQANEHKSLAWVLPSDLNGYKMPDADVPLINALQGM